MIRSASDDSLTKPLLGPAAPAQKATLPTQKAPLREPDAPTCWSRFVANYNAIPDALAEYAGALGCLEGAAIARKFPNTGWTIPVACGACCAGTARYGVGYPLSACFVTCEAAKAIKDTIQPPPVPQPQEMIR